MVKNRNFPMVKNWQLRELSLALPTKIFRGCPFSWKPPLILLGRPNFFSGNRDKSQFVCKPLYSQHTCSKGEGPMPAATSPLMCAISANRYAPFSSATCTKQVNLRLFFPTPRAFSSPSILLLPLYRSLNCCPKICELWLCMGPISGTPFRFFRW